MKWGNPQFLFLIILIPIVIFFYLWAIKKKKMLLNEFISEELQQRLLKNFSIRKQRIKYYFIITSIAFSILALIRPQWGFHWEEVTQRGVDIIVALDVSKSMLAQDVSPNRLDRAKQEIIDLLRILKGDRVGLIAFAGSAFLQAPLTLDYGAVQIFLDEVDTDLIPIPGTAIGQAIEKSIVSFDPTDKNSRVLILITDGEDHQANPVDVAKKAAAEGIKIFTIGIGQANGAPIPNDNGGFKKNSKGELVLTHLDEDSLQKIALETGGSYIRSTTGDFDLEKIYQKIISTVDQKDLSSGRRKRFEERFQWPLALALFFILLEAFFSEQKKRFYFFILFFFIHAIPDATASKISDGEKAYNKGEYKTALDAFTNAQIDNPKNLEIKYNLANTYYKMEDYIKAAELYENIASIASNDLSFKSLYNLGNSYFKQGKLKEAIETYQLALKKRPEDQQTKENLEFAQNELKKRLEEMKKQQEQQKKQQQQQDQQQDQQDHQDQKQDQQQKQNQQKNEGEQKESEEKKNQENKAQEQEKQDKQEEKKEAQGQEAKENGQKSGSQAQEAQESQDDKNMSKEEAEHWLSTLQEDRKKHNKEQMKKKQAGQRKYSVEKDW